MGGGYDPKGILDVARKLEELSERIDRKADALPADVDAGPFGKMLQVLVEGVGANCSAAVVRLVAGADQAREAAARQIGAGEASMGTIEDLLVRPLREMDDDTGR